MAGKVAAKKKSPKPRTTRKLSREDRDIRRLSGKIKVLSSELSELRKSATPREKTREIESDLYKEIRSLRNELKEFSKQASEGFEKTGNRMDSMQAGLTELRKLEEHVKRVDVMGVRRDIESLDSKHKWLENRIDKIDLDSLIDKIAELENVIMVIKANTPLIVE
jgi:division protein CdvB (Snf7/Vps24/ESCRT-III family)